MIVSVKNLLLRSFEIERFLWIEKIVLIADFKSPKYRFRKLEQDYYMHSHLLVGIGRIVGKGLPSLSAAPSDKDIILSFKNDLAVVPVQWKLRYTFVAIIAPYCISCDG